MPNFQGRNTRTGATTVNPEVYEADDDQKPPEHVRGWLQEADPDLGNEIDPQRPIAR